jgi:predicted ATPase
VAELPTGTVTFLFTDIEGSTKLLRELGDGYAEALAEHRRVVRLAVQRHGGVEVDTQGDAFFIAFERAEDALAAARASQLELTIPVRMGIHTGEPELTDEGYVGADVHRAARICSAAHGGQVVLSGPTRALVELDVEDLGEHRLKDFDEPACLYQLGEGRFPPLRTISNTNLPRPASSFVGRAQEVAEVASLVHHGARLVTLSGPGGSGKTRLAIEAAAQLVPEFKAGVFWVGLAPVRDPALVTGTIAQTIGAENGLAGHIGERELMLVLDNLEQVVEAAPELSSLVEACPNLRLLLTSRELLRVKGEVEYPVLPLADPEAVELFSVRAGSDPDEPVQELCRALDNLPLAVELAAARVSVLSTRQILDRLSKRLDLLKGGRDADPRQQTLRATIEWSYELLSHAEQQLFARLSVFVGGCTLEAAEEVCGADLDTLQGLVEKSLVRHTEERFWMLETIREYALERLGESGKAETIGRRHAALFLTLAESANLSVEAIEARGAERIDLVRPEQANLRAALQWALEHDPELGLGLAVALEQFWVTQDPFEGIRWFEGLLARAEDAPLVLRGRALRALGGSRMFAGDIEGGQRAWEQSFELFRRAGDEGGVMTMTFRMGTGHLSLGNNDRARELLEESLAGFRRLGKRLGECEALGNLGWLELWHGDVERGRELTRQSLELAREVGFTWWEASKLGDLAESLLGTGEVEEAGPLARQALTIWRNLDDRFGKVVGLALHAWVAAERSDPERAGTAWGAIEAEEDRGSIGAWEQYRDSYHSGVDALAGPEFERARAAGHSLSLDEAVEQALSERPQLLSDDA